MLVTLEGIDGSGKTTVAEALRTVYPDAVFTREPTDSWYGDAVRRSIETDDADPLAELFLYIADHAAHLSTTVRPALARDALVISDRYTDSRYAYQAATLADVDSLSRPLEYIRGIHEPWTRPPDVTLYFDIDPETGAERSGAGNKFEQAAFLEQVQTQYERLIDAQPGRFIRIDAEQPPEVVLERVEETLARVVDDGSGPEDSGSEDRS
ncbi:MAG: dTMP kinase [Halobacteriales archaeon]|nr:dTMP kinase [Halobacteriales archaeon]